MDFHLGTGLSRYMLKPPCFWIPIPFSLLERFLWTSLLQGDVHLKRINGTLIAEQFFEVFMLGQPLWPISHSIETQVDKRMLGLKLEASQRPKGRGESIHAHVWMADFRKRCLETSLVGKAWHVSLGHCLARWLAEQPAGLCARAVERLSETVTWSSQATHVTVGMEPFRNDKIAVSAVFEDAQVPDGTTQVLQGHGSVSHVGE